MPTFPNKTAWITGASSGIGRALSLIMARDGWRVAASARSEDDLNALSHEASDLKGEILAVPCDITDRDSIAGALEKTRSVFHSIDVAVLNAGTHKPVRAKSFSADDFRLLTDINLMGTVNCIEALLPTMMSEGRGKISVVASVAGYRGLPTSAAYGMTKAGLINMCEALKPELDEAGVDIQVICPGFVKTPLTDKNEFEMPFLMELEDGAQAMYKGICSDTFHVAFPWQMALMTKTLGILPSPIALSVTKNFMPDDKDGD